MRILVVDDSAPMGRMVVQQLRLGGHEAYWVASEEAAIDAAQDRRPDVVLIDIHLGGGDDGVRLARKLRRLPQTKNARLVGLSGDVLSSHARRGFDGFILKPVRVDALLAAVAE